MTYNLLRGVYKFQRGITPGLERLYDELYSEGQKPSVMLVGCSDSRFLPESMTKVNPGEMFFHRNVGNLIPVYSESLSIINSESSAIEYAVKGLGVKHIVICGHSDCGAMKNKLEPSADFPVTSNWVREQSIAIDKIELETDPNDSELTRTAQRNVVIQLQRLRTYPRVRELESKSKLTLHGWYFDISTKSIQVYDVNKKRFIPFYSALQIAMQNRLEDIVRGILLRHLNSLPRPRNQSEIKSREELYDKLKYNLKPVWKDIKEEVCGVLSTEFADMYTDNAVGMRALCDGAVFCKLQEADKACLAVHLNYLKSFSPLLLSKNLFGFNQKKAVNLPEEYITPRYR